MVTVVEEGKQTNMVSSASSIGEVNLVVEDSTPIDPVSVDQIPEFIREELEDDRRRPQLDAKPMLPQTSIEVVSRSPDTGSNPILSYAPEIGTAGGAAAESPKADELEALWPGVHHELIHSAKRQPSFYLMLGFMAGAAASLICVWTYSAVATRVAQGSDAQAKQIVVAGGNQAPAQNNEPAIEIKSTDPNATIVPISNVYEVKPGDTLVMIAMKNYKKVTPRLLDEIVRANGMKSANVLNLGQKIKLPNYKPQSALAATSSGQVH